MSIEAAEVRQYQGPDKKALRRTAQVERRLKSLGATEDSIRAINTTLAYFDNKEFKRTIPARDVLMQRMVDLTQGQKVPLVIFNCLDFDWEPSPGAYPRAKILDDTSTSIVGYFQNSVKADIAALEKLVPNDSDGGIDLCVIIPDSELFDERVFPFAQTTDERIRLAEKVKIDLSEKFNGFQTEQKSPVMFWSEYCKTYDLQFPADYTENCANQLVNAGTAESQREKDLFVSILKQQKSSKSHFMNKGMSYPYLEYDIPSQEMLSRITWYCAMYMGEGQALAESNAIVLNLEDFRVGKWYNIGSSDTLPIVTPVNPSDYYQWRNQRKQLSN